jgi:hypothetical protein
MVIHLQIFCLGRENCGCWCIHVGPLCVASLPISGTTVVSESTCVLNELSARTLTLTRLKPLVPLGRHLRSDGSSSQVGVICPYLKAYASAASPLAQILGISWAVLGSSWAVLVLFFGHLGLYWGHRGSILEPSGGPSWGHLGAVLGPSWGHFGPSWGHLVPSWAVLGTSWAILGPSWGHRGAILAPSWAILTPCWEHFGAIWSFIRLTLRGTSAVWSDV